ncbi:MAG: hemerythrin domain-containing protein [Nocardioidaceae bacterium]
MCEHCGCRGVEPIAELMDEHLELLDLGGSLRRHLARGDRAAAAATYAELRELLERHVRREERGVFAALKAQGDFEEAVTALEGEHTDFDATLAALDVDSPGFADAIEAMMADLAEHIDKENLGIFPVAVVTLGASGWEIVGKAHAEPSGLLAPG